MPPSNADPIVAQIRHDMQALVTYVTGPDSANQTACIPSNARSFGACWPWDWPCCASFS